MSDRYVLNDDGEPSPEPDLRAWAVWMQAGNRIISQKSIGNVRVSTVFLGLDHSFGHGNPVLFETMIFGGRHDQYQERYETRASAVAGHERAVRMVEETP